MQRREFVFKTSGLAFSVMIAPSLGFSIENKMNRIGMSTVIFRNRFKQTMPKGLKQLNNELKLLEIPDYYKKRFGLTNIEFWTPHFESLEKAYLKELKKSIKNAGANLLNIQADTTYDLASINEEIRLESIGHVKKWIDAAAFIGSKCIRINPGGANGSIESSIKSMRAVKDYAKSKKLILLTENHFGIEMDPEIHLKILREAGPDNMYTLPDFGNYPVDSMHASLKKIIPYAYMISAKANSFNDNMDHISYDFDKCVQLAESLGFKGIYSVEQWGNFLPGQDQEKVADWLIDHVSNNI